MAAPGKPRFWPPPARPGGGRPHGRLSNVSYGSPIAAINAPGNASFGEGAAARVTPLSSDVTKNYDDALSERSLKAWLKVRRWGAPVRTSPNDPREDHAIPAISQSALSHWTDDGLVFRTTSADNFNAIDPSLVTAADGGKWLALGSFFSGIKMIQLDAATGKPAASPTVYSLASKPFPDPEEGAGITYHDGYYYLFVSVDNCCRGISSTYHVQVGRSTSITGPYVDASGTAMTNGGGMEVQGTDAGMIGPGGEFVFTSGGSDWLVYHYYDAFDNGAAWIQIRPLTWVGGWPVTGQALVPVPGQSGPPAR